MQELLPLKAKIWLIVGLAALVASVSRWAGLGVLSLGVVVGVVEFVLIHLLMRSWGVLHVLAWLPLPAWGRTNLSGEWRGMIQSQWRQRPDDAAAAPIPAILNLRQGWQEVVFSLQTENMHSRSLAAVPSFDPVTNELQFRYFFETTPTAASSTRNPPQKMGSAIARVDLAKPNCMIVTYTNERGMGGDIVLQRLVSPSHVRRRSKRGQHERGTPRSRQEAGQGQTSNMNPRSDR